MKQVVKTTFVFFEDDIRDAIKSHASKVHGVELLGDMVVFDEHHDRLPGEITIEFDSTVAIDD